jgi:hypothetical protein
MANRQTGARRKARWAEDLAVGLVVVVVGVLALQVSFGVANLIRAIR